MALLSTPGGNEYPDDETPIVWTTLRDMARNRDARDREQVKAAAGAAVEAVDPRLSAVEARDGLDAGALTDSSVASVISQPDTQTHGALTGALDARYAQPGRDETITGDWTVSKGQTTNEDPPTFGLERKFVQGVDGALYDADTRLEMRISQQQSSTVTPPGYSMAEIALIDDSANDPIVQGETATMKIISNRFLFTRRLEVDMGGDGRATLRAGTEPRDVYLRLMMHNPNSPEFRIYGTTHPTADAGMAHLMEGRLRVEYSPAGTTTPVQVLGRDSSGTAQDTRLNQYADGVQSLEFRHGSTHVGGLQGHHEDNSVRLYATAGPVRVTGADLVFDPSRGPVLRSPDGSSWRLTVSDGGSLSAVKL